MRKLERTVFEVQVRASLFDRVEHAVVADVHTGDDSDHEHHEQDYYRILMPIRRELFGDSFYKGISHDDTPLPLELGSGYLLVVDVVVTDDTVS